MGNKFGKLSLLAHCWRDPEAKGLGRLFIPHRVWLCSSLISWGSGFPICDSVCCTELNP